MILIVPAPYKDLYCVPRIRGMIRSSDMFLALNKGVPHIRGDDPHPDYRYYDFSGCSPHPRG